MFLAARPRRSGRGMVAIALAVILLAGFAALQGPAALELFQRLVDGSTPPAPAEADQPIPIRLEHPTAAEDRAR